MINKSIFICLLCKSGFQAYKCQKRQYCSRECSYKAKHNRTPVQRFWNLVYKNGTKKNDCWEWIGGKCNGYGVFWYKNRNVTATRFSYMTHYDIEIAPSILVCHRCDNPSCVRPTHLFLGTHLDNMIDCVKKGRMPKGENRIGAKFTNKEANIIRTRYENGETQISLAREYKVSLFAINRIVNYKSYN